MGEVFGTYGLDMLYVNNVADCSRIQDRLDSLIVGAVSEDMTDTEYDVGLADLPGDFDALGYRHCNRSMIS